MIKRVLPVLGLLALLPMALQAQSPDQRMEDAKARVQSAGISVELLQSKIDEGIAKGAPADRIAAAVERRADGLVTAQEAMARDGKALSDADLAAGADAVGAGVSAAALTAVSEAPPGQRAVAIAVLTELVRLEVPVADALAQVQKTIESDPEALASLPGQAAAARGGPPAGVGPAGGIPAGPPAAVPAPGQLPGAANPTGAGRPGGTGRPGG